MDWDTIGFVLGIALLLTSVGAAALWITSYVRTRLGMMQPTVRAGLDLPEPEGGWPRVSIIVPIHNEEEAVEACVQRLIEQDYPDYEVILVLDRCTDRTPEIVRRVVGDDPRVTIIDNDHCPPDWPGKNNACRIGVDNATGTWLLFTDGDTLFDRGLTRASVATALHNGTNMLSLVTTLRCKHLFEHTAQPVACMNLLMMYNLDRKARGREPRPFANGQFMLLERDWYERIGGHGAVKDEVSEDMSMARLLVHQHHGRLDMLLADGMIFVTMYETLAAFRNGWRRIFTDACSRRPERLRRSGRRLIMAGVMLPLAQALGIAVGIALLATGSTLLGALLLASVAFGFLSQLVTLGTVYHASGTPRWSVLLFPAGCWIVGRVLIDSAKKLEERVPLEWAGRKYVQQPR